MISLEDGNEVRVSGGRFGTVAVCFGPSRSHGCARQVQLRYINFPRRPSGLSEAGSRGSCKVGPRVAAARSRRQGEKSCQKAELKKRRLGARPRLGVRKAKANPKSEKASS